MTDTNVGKRYAQAIFEIAKERNMVFETLKMLEVLLMHITENEDLRKFIDYPIIDNEQKKEFIDKIYADIKDFPLDILDYLVDKGRLSKIREIKDEYLNLYYDMHNKIVVNAIFPKELTEEQINRLTTKLEKKYKKKIVLKLEVNKDILGGGIVKAWDEVIDGSISSQINNLKNKF